MRALIITDTFFPNGDAMASRITSFCNLFKAIGYEVHVIALYTKQKNCDTFQIYSADSYTYQIATSAPPSSRDSFLGNNALLSRVTEYIFSNKVDVMFSTSCCSYFNKLSSLAKYNNIPYFVEQCEWLDVSSFKLGCFDPRYVRRNHLMESGYKKASGIIAISRLLDQHYRVIGLPVGRIPTILDVQNTIFRTETGDSGVNIVYTGSPGKSKEFFAPVIKTFAKNPDLQGKIQFHIYGPSRQLVLANIGGDEQLLNKAGDSVVIHGRAPQEDIHDILMNADYQLFIRPLRRSSNAGFPTKLGESMTVGTPVITNNTGDIGLYLKDGYNGYLLKDNSADAVKEAFVKIVDLTQKEIAAMRCSARKTAEENFDYRNYTAIISELLYEGK